MGELVLSEVHSLADAVKDAGDHETETTNPICRTVDTQTYGQTTVQEETSRCGVSEYVVPTKSLRGVTVCQSERIPTPHPPCPHSGVYGLVVEHPQPEIADSKSKCGDGAKKPVHTPLETFTRNPPWPHSHIHRLRPDVMVKAGFIFTGKEDIVKCLTCFLQVGQWLERTALEPIVVHRREQPLCPFVQGHTSGTHMPPLSMPVAMMTVAYYSNLYEQMVPSSGAKGSGKRDFSRYSVRLDSFREYDSSLPVSKYALADAGFFLTRLPDFTECFACGMVLKDWEEGDEPMKEHKSLAPRCVYVKTVEKAEAEMQQASPQPFHALASYDATQWDRRQAGLERQFTSMSVEATPMPSVVLSGRDAHMESYRPPPPPQGNLTAKLLDSPPTSPGARHRQGADYKPRQYTHWPGETGPAPILYPPASHELRKRDFTQFPASTSFGEMSLSSSQYGSGLSSTEMESDIKVCRVCMDRDIDAIFLPCGHVYCCSQCAKIVKVCPFCRCQVEKISHAYLPF